MVVRILAILWVMFPPLLLAQSPTELLEKRLVSAAGQERVEILTELISGYSTDDSARAVDLGTEALELLRSYPDREHEIAILNDLAYSHVLLGDYPTALQLGAQAEEMARSDNDRRELAFALRVRGRVYRYQGDYPRALEVFRQSARLCEEIGEIRQLADTWSDFGIVYWLMGDYPAALEHFIRAHRRYEQVEEPREIAAVLNNIGIVHRKLKNPGKALGFYHEALALRRRVGPDGSIANVLNNIGNIHSDLNDPGTALDYLLEALDIGLADKTGHANTLGNIGASYQELGDLDRALDYYQQALAIHDQTGNRKGSANGLLRVARVLRRRGDYYSALATLRRSLAIALSVDARDEIQRAHLDLSDVYSALGRHREALEAFKSYERVKSEIFNEENSKAIAEIQARFEFDRKAKEIELLEQQQTIDALEIAGHLAARKALLGGTGLLLIVIAVLYNRYRLKARSSRLIESKKTELEQTLGELRESEERYHRLFEDPSTAKLLVDPDSGTILDSNGAAGELLDRPPAELVGKTGSDLDSDWLPRILGELRRQPTDDLASVIETVQPRGARDLQLWVSRHRIAGKEAALVSLRDVTEQRHLEKERVRQQERERYIAELEARKTEVEAQNAELERFTYTVSHDLKSPLVTIQGFLGLLGKDMAAGDAGRMQYDLRRIKKASAQMGRLLDELLELSRIGRLVNPPEQVPMDELAREAIEILESQIVGHGVYVEVASDLPVVVGDPLRLLEVFQNLIENAVKFIGGQPRPKVEIGCRREEGETVYFVRDNGVGVDPRYHDKIFGLFERLDLEVDGTGVGLALVRRIVEVHGGRIWVESDGGGRGSTFCFTLPSGQAIADSAE